MTAEPNLPDVSADPARERALSLGLLALFVVMGTLAAADLAADLQEGTTLRHVLLEGGIVLTALAGVVWMAARVRALLQRAQALRREAASLQGEVADSRAEAARAHAEAARWRTEAGDLIAGLADAIDRQLETWGLSPAEKDVALLLLKGLSHKEIGAVRGVGEATVRQQSRALYKKAGLDGRAELAAFFLEDLLGPRALPATGASARELGHEREDEA